MSDPGGVAGEPPALADQAHAADARIVGKTNLHELAMLPLGTNPRGSAPRSTHWTPR
jgi:Asp-tRNA(Asn)/Glu-tRNA(Gln) amidotransferase A subunit family amidase